jgi:hypothetical protein
MIVDFGLLIRQLFHFAALYWELEGIAYETTYMCCLTGVDFAVVMIRMLPPLTGHLDIWPWADLLSSNTAKCEQNYQTLVLEVTIWNSVHGSYIYYLNCVFSMLSLLLGDRLIFELNKKGDANKKVCLPLCFSKIYYKTHAWFSTPLVYKVNVSSPLIDSDIFWR